MAAKTSVPAAVTPSKAPSLLFGLGLGGFLDGIVLHQVLQWHHMVSHVDAYPMTTVAGLEVNTLADGFFHLATWVLVLAASTATLVAWRRGRLAPSWSFHFGLVLAGWGLFNVVKEWSTTTCSASTTFEMISADRSVGTSGSWPSVWCWSPAAGCSTSGD